ncbi:MFS transporter [Actinoplanes sp. NBRC 101535]|uniref:MFS transporter n=1 Tax=Actinoplanes sp. NBRC 101535 TaxID=3032196 RepID=UPI002552EA92|nr:MFS transporter [Actinoplanes sp. NBRC 101535]
MKTTTGHQDPVTPWFMFVYWFAQVAAWIGILTPVVVTIAIRVADITTPAQKAAQLGTVLSIGALGAMLAAPIWGAVSDRTTARIGKRKLWMIVGAGLLLLGLVIMAFSPNMVVFGAGWLICQVGSNANQAALNAVMPDVVPERQRGIMSGLLGLSVTVAMLVGTFITQFTSGNTVAMFLVPWLFIPIALGMFLATFKDSPADRNAVPAFRLKDLALSFWINPVQHRDFGWAFLSRFLLFLGTAFFMTYQAYFLTDHLKVGAGELARFVFFSTFVTAIITVIVSLLGGWLSDRFSRRKPFVFVAALIAGAGLLVIGFSHDFTQFMVGAALVSLGQGLYYAVDIALAAAVLPSNEEAAKGMGVFQIANSLPQSLAPILAPVFLAIGAGGDNYPAVFIAGTVFAIAGALVLGPVKNAK